MPVDFSRHPYNGALLRQYNHCTQDAGSTTSRPRTSSHADTAIALRGFSTTTAATPVWMGPIRPLIVSEIENFERKEWKILSHDHISPYLTGTCDVVIRRTTRASRQRKSHRDRAIPGPKRAAHNAGSQQPRRALLRDFGTRQVRMFADRSSLRRPQCSCAA